MIRGYTYILLCSDDSFYTGSTKNLIKRLFEHQSGIGSNHTKKRLPVKLVYYEEYTRIDLAFNREKQIQGWSRNKKKALIDGNTKDLPFLSICHNISNSIFIESRKFQMITPELERFAEEIIQNGKRTERSRSPI
ncbi:MAG: GIY-YIG nuclease family protein [Crocinitomicaceae bacterium]|nr:GIY-YIG nuclease family protein [Crocinitomicaceae bacterium]